MIRLSVLLLNSMSKLIHNRCTCRVVSRFVSSRFHPKSRWLLPFYFSNITLRTDLLTFGVTGGVFKIVGEMCRLQAYFDNPVHVSLLLKLYGYKRVCKPKQTIESFFMF